MILDKVKIDIWVADGKTEPVGEWLLSAAETWNGPTSDAQRAQKTFPFFVKPTDHLPTSVYTDVKSEASNFASLLQRGLDYALLKWNDASGFAVLSDLLSLAGLLGSSELESVSRRAFIPNLTKAEDPYNVGLAFTELIYAVSVNNAFSLNSPLAKLIDSFRRTRHYWRARHVRPLLSGLITRRPEDWPRVISWLATDVQEWSRKNLEEANALFDVVFTSLDLEPIVDGLGVLPASHANWLVPMLFDPNHRRGLWKPPLNIMVVAGIMSVQKAHPDERSIRALNLAATPVPEFTLKKLAKLIKNPTPPPPGNVVPFGLQSARDKLQGK
jgi:hypothetical protein